MVRVAMVVTNACSPDPRVLRHATWLLEAGFQVTIHAFDRKQAFAKSENHGGVRIMRYHLGDVPYGGLTKTYVGIRKFQHLVVKTLLHDPPSLVYCNDADTLHIGTQLHQRLKIPFVFDMHDLSHTWIRFPAPRSMLRALLSGIMKKRMLHRARKASCILTTSSRLEDGTHDGFVEWLGQYGLSATCVENRPLPPFGEPKSSTHMPWTVGYIGRVRDVEAMKLLAKAVTSIPVELRPRIRIAGDGVAAEEVKHLMESSQGLDVEVSSSFSQNEVIELICELDVMYAMYSPERGNILQGAVPVKMFDAAAQGVPSIVNEGCLMSDLAIQEKLGLAVMWGDHEKLASALLEAKEMIVELNITGEREHRRWLKALDDIFKAIQ